MFEELNQDQVHAPEPTNSEPTATEQTVAEPESKPQESKQSDNFRMLRDRADAAERRALELERVIKMNMSQNQPSAKIQVEEEEDYGFKDDDYIEGKQLKKLIKSLKQENSTTKKQFEEFHQQNALAQAEIKLKSQFADFDSIVSKENIEKLAASKPSLYRSIMANQDIYDRGYTAYEMIKGSGMLSENYAQQDKRLEENRAKPRSAANVAPQTGDTPLARVGDYDRRVLTEERKDQLRRQVEEAKRFKQ
jgi:hypothetical protein